MKIGMIIFAFVLIALFLFILLFLKQSDDTTVSVGSIDDIESNIEKLMRSGEEDAFLIATVHGTGDYVQFTADAKSVQLDFPLITDRQKSLEMAFRSVSKGLGLEVMENSGSGGEKFLDVTIEGTAAEIAVVAASLMKKLFRIDQNEKIGCESNT
jgi:hypothetical protein